MESILCQQALLVQGSGGSYSFELAGHQHPESLLERLNYRFELHLVGSVYSIRDFELFCDQVQKATCCVKLKVG